MRKASDIATSGNRRVPRQARAEQRVEALIAAAAAIIAENGYEAATLTAVAERAGASIGSLYQYFPDKSAVARALARRYGAELAESWRSLIAEAGDMTTERLVGTMFATVARFHADHPAFLPLMTAHSAGYRHADADHDRLRTNVAALLQAHRADWTTGEAARMSEVVIRILKAMGEATSGEARASAALESEFRIALLAYLRARLPRAGSKAATSLRS